MILAFFLAFAPCWKTVRDIGKYHRICIPPAKIDSMRTLVPLWSKDATGRYVYQATRGDSLHLYRHTSRDGTVTLSHLK